LLPYFQQSPVFSCFTEERQKLLERECEQRDYRRRQPIHFADTLGDFVYLLCTGSVSLSSTSEKGRPLIHGIVHGCDIFGEQGLVAENKPYGVIAETLEDCHVAVFRRNDIIAALTESPLAWPHLFSLVSERRSLAETMSADLVFKDVPRRIAELLVDLNKKHGTKHGKSGSLIKVKYTHQQLADMIGSTRETTTLILNDFKKSELITFSGRKIVVHKLGELQKIADPSLS